MWRYKLSNEQWKRIELLLTGRSGYAGVTAADNRLFVDTVLYRFRASVPWRDLPQRFGDWKNVHRRYSRWGKTGVWARIFAELANDADNLRALLGTSGVLGVSAAEVGRVHHAGHWLHPDQAVEGSAHVGIEWHVGVGTAEHGHGKAGLIPSTPRPNPHQPRAGPRRRPGHRPPSRAR